MIYLWSTTEDKLVGQFKQHRDAVSGVSFLRKQNHLYSCSFDRTVKVWNADELSYVETL